MANSFGSPSHFYFLFNPTTTVSVRTHVIGAGRTLKIGDRRIRVPQGEKGGRPLSTSVSLLREIHQQTFRGQMLFLHVRHS